MKCPNNWFKEIYLSSFWCLKTLTPSFLFCALAFNWAVSLRNKSLFFPNNWNFDNFAERSWRAVSLIIDFRPNCNLPKRWRRTARAATTRWQTGLWRCFCKRSCLWSSVKDYVFVRRDWALTMFQWKIMSLLGAIELWWCFSERLFLCFRRDWASLRTVRRPLRSLQTAPLSGSPSYKEMNMKIWGEVDCLKTFPSRSLSVGDPSFGLTSNGATSSHNASDAGERNIFISQ